ncbi:cysteine desulfurase family protein [Hirschia baltica]|uniref:Cysteine desulfurase n=1 Tax=Hirschia baltica (strain ATCC 49814 / DSM 5838 / IFAM 1418) TaxID=582402 RepID=C6XJ37_HIRBI|nr:cysteine desulfurase family protein [Hirschia baltica]ACT59132.1 Cysteine desulfurase [Hirschia baltica ATCC 49814]
MAKFDAIYCDYNATAPLRPQAKDAMIAAMDIGANPSSVHGQGRAARACLENAREVVAGAIGACREDLTFTSGGTEANAAILNGIRLQEPLLMPIVCGFEHDAVLAQLPDAIKAQVTPDGLIDLEWLKELLENWPHEGRQPLLSLMLANNETGAIQPVEAAANLIHEADGLIHCDAVQGVGKMSVSVLDGEIDYMTLSGHKVGGPSGIGAFYVRAGAPFKATLLGGGQELGRRSGTQNLVGAAGFAAAVDVSLQDLEKFQEFAVKRDTLEKRLKTVANVTVFAENVPRLANTSCLSVEGLRAETQVMAMDLAGVAVSSGSACSSGKVKQSHVLASMGVAQELSQGAIRLSFGWASQDTDFDKAGDAWLQAAQRKGINMNIPNKETA